MTLSNIFSRLNSINAEVTICRSTYRYTDDSERWACTILLDNSGTEIKVRATAADGDTALCSAFDKFDALLAAPAVNRALNLPLLSVPCNDAD